MFSLEQWRLEVSTLLSDIQADAGNLDYLNSLEDEAGAAWARVRSSFNIA